MELLLVTLLLEIIEAYLVPFDLSTIQILAVYCCKKASTYMFDGVVNGSRYSRMDQVRFVDDSLEKIWSDRGRPYQFKFFNGCLLQILLGPFLNTLTQILLRVSTRSCLNRIFFGVSLWIVLVVNIFRF